MSVKYREPYDPTRDFVARKAFTCRGVKYAPGAPFDRDAVDDRRLQQMYEGRWLEFTRVPPKKSQGLLASIGIGA